MLTLIVPGSEWFDEAKETFENFDGITLDLEHSLISLSKWESKFQKPFLGREQKTTEETIEYIRFMIVTPNVSEDILSKLTVENLTLINDYVESKQSATTFREDKYGGRGEVITAELIYYWMVAFNIPFQCETWHLNRLFSLIRICNIKNSKPKKTPRNELLARNRDLNAQRRAQLGTMG